MDAVAQALGLTSLLKNLRWMIAQYPEWVEEGIVFHQENRNQKVHSPCNFWEKPKDGQPISPELELRGIHIPASGQFRYLEETMGILKG